MILWSSLSNLTVQTIDEGNSARRTEPEARPSKGVHLVWAIHRTAQARPKTESRGAGARDGPTNEVGDMFTYQVLIQTLQLSEKSGTSWSPKFLEKV